MTDYAIIYDAATGAQIGNYMGPDGTAKDQALPDGAALMLVPMEAWTTPVGLDAVKKEVCAQIEAGVDAKAAAIITLSPRKVLTTFALKEESDRWTTGGVATDFPFLNALAIASSTTIDAEKAAFDAVYTATTPPGAKLNAASIAAQRRVTAATNLAEIATAAAIDWAAVLA